jgi:amino acid adenylation domain-containing protein
LAIDAKTGNVEASYADERIFLSEDVTDQLRAFARDSKLTLNVVAQAAWTLLLTKYSGEDDVLFGVTVSGRPAELARSESMVGLFINTLPLRVAVNPDQNVLDWLRHLQDEQSRMQQFEHSSLIDIQSWSEVPRGVPLFESIFVFENLPVAGSYQARESSIEFVEDRGLGSTTGYPLTVLVSPGKRMAVQIVYDRTRFETAAIQRMLRHYEQLLQSLAASGDHRVAQVQMLTAPEREQIHQWNDTSVTHGNSASLVKQFEEQVARTPEQPALVFNSQRLSYAQLNARANRLANYLGQLGVGRDRRLGICLERSIEMVVGVLATLKAGAAYVPLDPEYPTERLRFMLSDSSCAVVLTSDDVADRLPDSNARIVRMDRDAGNIEPQPDANPDSEIFDEQLAYIIYTSGSTGRPKGVAMPHGALRNLIGWQLNSEFTPARTVQFSSLSFDVSFQELFSTWCSGGTLVLVSQEVRRDPAAMVEFLRTQRIERIFLPFVYLQHLAEAAQSTGTVPESLRDVITAGEQLEITSAIRKLFEKLDNCRLHNQYGPSESHVVTAHTLSDQVREWPILPPIGRPIANTQIYIVDRNFEPVPVGIPGELLIGGANVSRGYLDRSGLTAERFVPDPFSATSGARVYRTGDLARHHEDGEIQYLGRSDSQVKIRGFRIEPGEIETALAAYPSITQAVVAVRRATNANVLIAYVVTGEPGTEGFERDLRAHLKSVLPEYMVPTRFVFLDALPLTSSGKIDRRALPEPDQLDLRTEAFQAPETADQIRMAEIWQTVLQRRPIGIHDNFFELGGHSLIATQLTSRVRQAFQVNLPLRSLFESPTIAELLESLKRWQAIDTTPTVIAAEPVRDVDDLLSKLDEMSDSDVDSLLNDLLAEHN